MSGDRSQQKPWRAGATVALCAVAAMLVALAAPSQASAAPVQCAGTFRVLHDDRVGNLDLPRGNYRITTLGEEMPSCARASVLFSHFLEDFDGVLPGGWRLNAATRTFQRGPGFGFQVTRVGGGGGTGGGGSETEEGGGGKHPIGGNFCPATFRVLGNDRIGSLRLAKGPYWVILLQRQGLSCAQASQMFTRFLDATNGVLPVPWTLQPQTASFRQGAAGPGFRVKPAS